MLNSEECQMNDIEESKRVESLNRAFQQGKKVFDNRVQEDLQAIKKPILLDFNNVLADNKNPLTSNPEGEKLIKALSEIGDVVIVTSAQNWNAIHDFLMCNNMWNEKIILMVNDNWNGMSSSYPISKELEKVKAELLEKYKVKLQKMGRKVSVNDLQTVAAKKPVAALFHTSKEIPLIDDLHMSTDPSTSYPGIFGIRVISFPDGENQGISFEEAIIKVRNHYNNSIDKTQAIV